jgi:hypothetical protein
MYNEWGLFISYHKFVVILNISVHLNVLPLS